MKKVTCTSSYVNSLFCGEESELSYITGSPWLTLALGTSYVPYFSAYTKNVSKNEFSLVPVAF